MKTSRRVFLKGLAAGAGYGLAGRAEAADPPKSVIDHVVLVMMENRSFDHFLGWLPGADGKQAGLVYADRAGQPHDTYHLTDYQGCAHPDPDHTYSGGRIEYDNGLCDGWLRAGQNDDYAIGYYTQADLSFLGQAAPAWTSFDRYFAATMDETLPNRIYQHAAQTDRTDSSTFVSTLPTIWDRLAANGISGRYYYSDLPVLALWGTRYVGIGRLFADFLADCAANTLPNVAFVDPRFVDEQNGTSDDDHPHADIRNGEAFLNDVYQAVTSSPAWHRTVLIINFDEWGGFFDHVPPGIAPDPNPTFALRGFRVPCVLVSHWARRGYVAHEVFDHTSVLKLIEWRWDLEPLTVRDASANNLASVLGASGPHPPAPVFNVPPGPFGAPCGTPTTPTPQILALLTLAQQSGWNLSGLRLP